MPFYRFCLVVSLVTAFCSTHNANRRKVGRFATNVDEMKTQLLEQCEACDMGRKVELRPLVEEKLEALEALNPTPRPLEAPDLLTACWVLKYTTADSILGTSRLRPFRPRPRILQSIDAKNLRAKNEEWLLLGALRNSVVADLEPRDDGQTIDVQFRRFGIGWLRIRAPKSARGFLNTTFLDHDLRISRGDRGNIFILQRDGPPRRI
uniref:Plastid lipid-associated protein/fibrillin conserved domain-containing protein n=1 Tax=Aureoumbra lagunensis TaxID=44058 RepID=A0A7S3K0C3_9STRA|mmetsp:Transcript_20512/g.31327  ORF Transcript_20512/g.31327 Transcript_20512/m.31327 type:complete len:207 (+) Transcript_20512:149-769(+)